MPPAPHRTVVEGPPLPPARTDGTSSPVPQPDDNSRRLEANARDTRARDVEHGVECSGDAHFGSLEWFGFCNHNPTSAKCASCSFREPSSVHPAVELNLGTQLPTRTRGVPHFAALQHQPARHPGPENAKLRLDNSPQEDWRLVTSEEPHPSHLSRQSVEGTGATGDLGPRGER